jgi:hypothetical protein
MRSAWNKNSTRVFNGLCGKQNKKSKDTERSSCFIWKTDKVTAVTYIEEPYASVAVEDAINIA